MALLREYDVFDGVDVVSTCNLSFFLHLFELIGLINSHLANQLLYWDQICLLNGHLLVVRFYVDFGRAGHHFSYYTQLS